MKCQEKITLSTLSEEDSWTLFVRNAGRSFESTNFDDVARRVAGECCGLPIALIAVARALGDKDLVEWKRAAQQLEKSQTANADDYGEVYNCIKLSYDYLKDEDYKSCFLLCCLFPEDYDIPIEELFRYAIGKGLFRDAETLEEARDKADSVARHLKYSCLLLESEYGGDVRVHDVVRDTAIQIAKSEHGGILVRAGCGLKDWPRQLHEAYSAVSLMRNHIDKLPEKLVCPELQILLINDNICIKEIPKTFFQSPNELKVLDLSETGITLLPESFSLLTNLQALYLDDIVYSKDKRPIDTSILGKLKKLEILSMRGCFLKVLSREMGNLINLRMLDITGGVINTILSNVISKWHNLEELYMEQFSKWGSKVEGEGEQTNAGFDEVTSLSNLRVLKVFIPDAECIPKDVKLDPNWVEFNIHMGGDEMREGLNRFGHDSILYSLEIYAIIGSLPDWFCNAVMNRARRLIWQGCRRLIDIFGEFERGRLQGLKSVILTGTDSNELMNKITWFPKDALLKNLEELHLAGVDCQELCVGKLPSGSLFNLKVLWVHFCYNWGWNVLLPSTLLQGLPNLEEVNCSHMVGIEYVFEYEALLALKPSILRIELVDLNTLRSICDGPAPPAVFETLQSLSITWCNLQGSLFTSDDAQYLSQLSYLDLQHCPFLERIVEASNKEIILPKLKQLCLKELPMLYYDSVSVDIECPSLEELDVRDCPKFSASFYDFTIVKQVQLRRYVAVSEQVHRCSFARAPPQHSMILTGQALFFPSTGSVLPGQLLPLFDQGQEKCQAAAFFFAQAWPAATDRG